MMVLEVLFLLLLWPPFSLSQDLSENLVDCYNKTVICEDYDTPNTCSDLESFTRFRSDPSLPYIYTLRFLYSPDFLATSLCNIQIRVVDPSSCCGNVFHEEPPCVLESINEGVLCECEWFISTSPELKFTCDAVEINSEGTDIILFSQIIPESLSCGAQQLVDYHIIIVTDVTERKWKTKFAMPLYTCT